MKELKQFIKDLGDFEFFDDGIKLPVIIEIDGITYEI